MYAIRCQSCNKLLAKAKFSSIQIKCPRCKTTNTLNSEAHEAQTNKDNPRGKPQPDRQGRPQGPR